MVEAQPLMLAQWTSELMTRTEIKLQVRPAAIEDEPQLIDFFRHVSADDLRFRFLSTLRSVGHELAHRLVDVDHSRTENLLAFDASDGRLAATAMIAADDELEEAEVAIAVRSDLRSRGIGWAMLGEACAYAEARGIKRIQSIESFENRAAISLEEEMGFKAMPYAGDSSLTLLTKELGAG